jgi:3-deoxy-D-arabino-heptulosonate 7-phosphate (DAHP) synthase
MALELHVGEVPVKDLHQNQAKIVGGCSKDALIVIFTCTIENEASIISYLKQISVKDDKYW